MKFFITAIALSAVQVVHAYDITNAIDASLKNNIQLKENEINLASVKLNRFSAATEFLPTIMIQSQTSGQTSKGEQRLGGTPVSDQLSISQSIFSGGKGIYDLKSTKYASDAALMQYQNSIDAVIVQTVQAYETVIAAREIYSVAQQKVESLKKIQKQSEIKYELGVITKTDMLQAKASLAAAMSEKEAIYAEMRDREENYKYITGDTPPPDLIPIDVQSIHFPQDINLFLDEVEQKNLNILAANKNLISKKFATRSAKSALLPTVNASLSVGQQQTWQSLGRYAQLQKYSGETYQISVNIPIFQSGQEYVNIKKAQLAESSASVNKDGTIMQIHKEAASAWNNYTKAKSNLVSDADSVKYYQEFSRGAYEEFQVGTKTLTDLLQAQLDYENSRAKLIQDKATFIISTLNLKYFLGEIKQVNFSKLVAKNNNEIKTNTKTIQNVSSDNIQKISEISDKQTTN